MFLTLRIDVVDVGPQRVQRDLAFASPWSPLVQTAGEYRETPFASGSLLRLQESSLTSLDAGNTSSAHREVPVGHRRRGG